jgi:hypothetical protein
MGELHNNRRLFYYHSDQPLRLAEFIDKLRQSKPAWRWCNGHSQVLEEAYDLTISKFSGLPDTEKEASGLKSQGPDCRYYYEAFIRHAAKKMDEKTFNNEAARERQSARLLQNLVVRHFRLSCCECRGKSRDLTKRYLWKLDGCTMNLLLPVDIPSNQTARWLQENIPDVNPSRPGERSRVQARIDELAVRRKILSLENITMNEAAACTICSQLDTDDELTVKKLAEVIADEKAKAIDSQRPAIRQLGRVRLKKLIVEIFESLSCGTYEALSLARDFGVSPATLSRFAGSRWSGEDGSNKPVPDLWVNTARMLSGEPVFVEAAQSAGVFSRVQQVLKKQ